MKIPWLTDQMAKSFPERMAWSYHHYLLTGLIMSAVITTGALPVLWLMAFTSQSNRVPIIVGVTMAVGIFVFGSVFHYREGRSTRRKGPTAKQHFPKDSR